MSGEKLEVGNVAKEVVLTPAFTAVLSDEERKKYTFKDPFPQEFSLPSEIVYYIAQNPLSPNGHLKLISTCKSLFLILPIEKLEHGDDNNEDYYKWDAGSNVSINLKDQRFKLWVHDQISVFTDLPDLASTLVKHIYKFTLRELTLFKQDLTFGELKILVSGDHLETVLFGFNVVKNNDQNIVEFEKVFELLCCKKLTVYLPDEEHGVGKNTAKTIIEILSAAHVPDKLNIVLTDIPQNFDFHVFSEFLKANMTAKQHSFFLSFADETSDIYQNELQEFVYEIIQLRGIHAIPLIEFRGQNDEAFATLYQMRSEMGEGIELLSILRLP